MPFRSRVSIASAFTVSSSVHPEQSYKQPSEVVTGMEPPHPPSAAPTPVPDELPPPVTATTPFSSDRRKQSKKTRVTLGLHVRWDRFLRKLGSGTAPSTSSALEDASGGDSLGYYRFRTAAASAVDDAEVDEVVVDREWSGEIKSSVHSEHGASPEKSGGSNPHHGVGTGTEIDSVAIHAEGFWAKHTILIWTRYRIWPAILAFFVTQFLDEKSEQHYNKESWFMRKSLAMWCATFYIINWALATGFIPHPAKLPDKIFYYGVTPALTFPLFFLVVYDFPRDRPMFYQIYLGFSSWMWSCYQLIFMTWCGYYTRNPNTCGGKDFLITFYYTSAMQTIAMFGLGFSRLGALIGIMTFTVLSFALIVPDRTYFVRNIINTICFHAFLLYIHYMRENAERRLYTLRDQLKIQFRATQKAQVNERKAADSKRRLTSYVFHEVRVPLNTALLAVQNMDASGTVAKTQEIEFKALEGSLSMMSKVLNDVLDFNRMDSGRFESVLKPYAFHQVMRSLFVPLQLATDARGLEFITDLDRSIDEVARVALYEAQGNNQEAALRKLVEMGDAEDGIVVGDETRLRQIITNLASNACKFTPAGGKLIVSTKLVIPNRLGKEGKKGKEGAGEGEKEGKEENGGEENGHTNGNDTMTLNDTDEKVAEKKSGISASMLSQHNVLHSKPTPLEWIVVRIEVTDTGCGIRPKDMVQSKLFSAFNQTEMGRQQGGKGTGLGLALVRQIVKRSGGRLGVQSKVHEGSTFWVELPLGVGNKVVSGLLTPHSRHSEADTSATAASRNHSKQSVNSRTTKAVSLANQDSSSPPLPDAARPSSALQSIMEQGGLVEISTKPHDNTRVLTRLIGDPSTGTEPARSPDESPPFSPPTEFPSLIERPPPPKEENSDATIKPPHLELPKPRDFIIHEVLPRPMTATPPAQTPSGSTFSNTALSTTTSASSSIYFEQGLRVLVVDDDPLTRKLMSRMLTRLGCKVTTAENGEVALELILNTGGMRATPSSEDTGSGGLSSSSELPSGMSMVASVGGGEGERFAVVFLDNQMPVLSGLEAVSKLREMGRNDFVVGVTGNALLTDQQEYLEAGVNHVLTKPVYEKSLKAMLAIADERRRRETPSSERAELALSS